MLRPIHGALGHLLAFSYGHGRLARPINVVRASEQGIVVVNLAVRIHSQRDGAGLVELARSKSERYRVNRTFCYLSRLRSL